MELSHIDSTGKAKMVDVSKKTKTERIAVAIGRVYLKPETLSMIVTGNLPKGDVIPTARTAGIMAAKRTWDLIPLCHNIPIDSVKLDISIDKQISCVNINSIVKCTWKTGVEMEALTAVSVAALTVYDMCKAVDKEMIISEIKLVKKTGGKSGDYFREGFENI